MYKSKSLRLPKVNIPTVTDGDAISRKGVVD